MSKMTMKKPVSAQQLFMVMILVTYAWIVCGKTPPHFHIVVAKDGTGNFTRISDAIKAAPINSPNRTFIKIRAGLYEETIVIGSEHSNLTLIGDGMDQTIISGNKSVAGGFQTFETATLGIAGTGFVAQDIAVQNTAGPNGSQAVALRSTSSFSTFFRCKITGFQDTLLVHEGIQFYRECDIYGTVDFIFGHARVIFQNCNIYGRQPIRGQSITITAQNMDPSVGETAIVLHNCTITATKDLRTSEFPVKMYLGRPWSNYSTTVIMQSFIDRYVDSTGWLDWEDRSRLDTVHYIEYDNRGPGANTSGRVRWRGYRALHNSSGAISFTVRRFIKGDDWIPLTGVPYHADLI